MSDDHVRGHVEVYDVDRGLAFVGIDGGGMTGFFGWFPAGGVIEIGEGVPGVVTNWVEEWVARHVHLVLAAEHFIIRPRTHQHSPQYDASHLNGVVKDMRRRFPNVRVLLQTSSDAKSIAPNERLRKLGWYRAGFTHGHDAARHVLLAVSGFAPSLFDELMTPDRVSLRTTTKDKRRGVR